MTVKVLYLGSIVSKAGIYALKQGLSLLKEREKVDFVIAGANYVTSGHGLGFNHAMYLRKLGVDILTLGDLAFFHKDLFEKASQAYNILRPANYPSAVPGFGWCIHKKSGISIGVISLLGQSGYSRIHLESPFKEIEKILFKLKEKDVSLIFVDFYAMTTAERKTFFYHVQGSVTSLFSSQTRILTADAQIKNGTAYITGAGRTGSQFSVGGFDPLTEITRFKMAQFPRTMDSWENIELQGILIKADANSGQSESIEIVRLPVKADQLEKNFK